MDMECNPFSSLVIVVSDGRHVMLFVCKFRFWSISNVNIRRGWCSPCIKCVSWKPLDFLIAEKFHVDLFFRIQKSRNPSTFWWQKSSTWICFLEFKYKKNPWTFWWQKSFKWICFSEFKNQETPGHFDCRISFMWICYLEFKSWETPGLSDCRKVSRGFVF